jgi:hypothetical protein
MVFLGEELDLSHFIGMGLICLSLMAIDGRILRYIKKRSSAQEHAHLSTKEI